MATNRRSSLIPGAAIALLCCAAFAFLVSRFIQSTSATFDETAHLPAGYSYLKWGDYRMNPEHPPLVKELAALALAGRHVWPESVAPSPRDGASAGNPDSAVAIDRAWASGFGKLDAQWVFGHALLYGVTSRTLARLGAADPQLVPTTVTLATDDFLNDADALISRGRLAVLALGLVLALLVFAWSSELHGAAGGILAVALYCFDPNFIAHSGLVTTDVGAALFMFGAVYALWKAARRLDALPSAWFGLSMGLAFASKFSTLLLVPIVALLLARRAASSEAWPLGRGGARALETRRARALAAAALFGAALLVSGLVVWASYGFRYSAAADPAEAARMESQVFGPQGDAGGSAPGPPREAGHFPLERIVRRTAALGALLNRYPDGPPDDVVDREMAAAPIGAAGASILFAARHRLLPEAYLFGLSYARMKSLQRASFLNGDLSSRGFRSYLPWAFLLKTPLLTLALLAGAALLALARRSSRRGDLAFLVVPVAVYFLASLASNLNIGHRHLLPIYPFLFVLCGLLGREWAALARVPAAATAALVLSGIALGGFVVFAPPWSPEVVYPHYLAYFNELAGGPRDGYRHLVDSNLDWGQDLKGLHEWAVRHGIDANNPLYLCYFGMADPRFYGIPHVNLPGGYPLAPQARVEALPPGAFLAVSATNLQGVYFSPPVRDTWRSILAHSTLVDTIGYSIFVYRIGPPAS